MNAQYVNKYVLCLYYEGTFGAPGLATCKRILSTYTNSMSRFSLRFLNSTCLISLTTFHAAMIPDKTSTQRIS